MDKPEQVNTQPVKYVVEQAIERIDGGSLFDKLVSLRDEAARLVNAERENEKKRVAEARDKLKADLKAQTDRLRAVSTITKPRGARKAAVSAGVTE